MRRGRATRTSRLPAILCGVTALAVAGVALASPSEPSAVPGLPPEIEALPVEATVSIPGTPGGIAAGLGSIWVASLSTGVLYRIDPESNAVSGSVRYRAGGGGGNGVEDPVAVGGGAVWVASEADDRLVKIDPAGMRVVWKRPFSSIWGVAYAGGSVWVPQLEEGSVARVAPGNGKVLSRQAAIGPSDVAPGPTGVWALEHRGSALLRMRARTGKRLARVPFEARAPERLAVGSGAAWVSDTLGWVVVRVNTATPNRKKEVAMPAGGETMPGNMAAGGGYVWVGTIQSHVLRIDPRTNTVTGGAQVNAAPGCANPKTGGCVLDVAFGNGSVWVGDIRAKTVLRLSPDA